MSRTPLPTDEVVRAAADDLLTQHRAGGPYPSVSSLAKRFHINRTTFYRHYYAITDAMLDTAAHQHTNGTQRRRPPFNIARARRVVILPARLETKKHCTLG